MFERYTEKARRVIFFARYEASQFGSPLIETEHLLLGIFRDDKELIRRVLLKLDIDSVRQEIVSRIKPGEHISTNIDLPLSDQAKRAVIYAAEEADRLNHRHIGTAHLLLGLMREKEFASAEFLSRFRVTLESLRKRVEALGEPPQTLPNADLLRRLKRNIAARFRALSVPSMVELHGIKRNLEEIHTAYARCHEVSWQWKKKRWRPRDVVMKKDGKTFSFDRRLVKKSSEFVLMKGGWKKDHCAICHWALFESDDASRGTAFTNGRDWVCTECHQKFIAGDFFASTYTDIT